MPQPRSPHAPSPGSAHLRRPSPGVRLRRRRVTVGLVALLTLVVVALLLPSGGHTPSTSAPRRTGAKTTAIPSIEAGVLPWSLDTPLSREVLLASGGSTITAVGGLNAGQTSVSAIFTINTDTGDETTVGTLAA